VAREEYVQSRLRDLIVLVLLRAGAHLRGMEARTDPSQRVQCCGDVAVSVSSGRWSRSRSQGDASFSRSLTGTMANPCFSPSRPAGGIRGAIAVRNAG
jgi:hypothetical protein